MNSDRRPAVLVCEACRAGDGATGAALAGSLQQKLKETEIGAHVRVVPTACLNACGNPVSIALSGDGKASYVFNRIDPALDLNDILATIRQWLASTDGMIEDARACGRLRFCLAARIPSV